MEIVNLRSAKLTNYEVMMFLQEQRDSMIKVNKKEKKKRTNQRLNTVTFETINWLETQPAKVQVTSFIKNLF